MTVSEPTARVWRLAGFTRRGVFVVTGVPVVAAVVSWIAAAVERSGEAALSALGVTGVAVAYAAFGWWMFLRPKLVLTEDELVVVNPWGTTRVALEDVVRVHGGFTGGYVQLRSGWSVRVFALAEAYGGGRDRGRRVAEVADALRAAQRPAARG